MRAGSAFSRRRAAWFSEFFFFFVTPCWWHPSRLASPSVFETSPELRRGNGPSSDAPGSTIYIRVHDVAGFTDTANGELPMSGRDRDERVAGSKRIPGARRHSLPNLFTTGTACRATCDPLA